MSLIEFKKGLAKKFPKHYKSFIKKAEVSALLPLVSIDNLLALAEGFYKGSGLIALTRSNLVWVYKGLLFGTKIKKYPAGKITGFSVNHNPLYSTIFFSCFGEQIKITHLNRKAAEGFMSGFDSIIEVPALKAEDAYIKKDPVSALETLKELLHKRLITEVEYKNKKQDILKDL